MTVGAAAVTGLPDESAALTVKTAPVEAVGPAAVTEPEFGIYPTLTVAVRVAVLPEKVTAYVAITVPAEFLTVTVVTPARPEAKMTKLAVVPVTATETGAARVTAVV